MVTNEHGVQPQAKLFGSTAKPSLSCLCFLFKFFAKNRQLAKLR